MFRELIEIIYEVIEDLRFDLISAFNYARATNDFSLSKIVNALIWQSWSIFLGFRKLAAPIQALTSLVLVFAWLFISIRLYMLFTTAKCSSVEKMNNKTVLITGANAGIGFETALDLARRGARVILACRNPDRASVAASTIRDLSGNDDVVFIRLDLSDMSSVRQAAAKVIMAEPRLDILICNAGVALSRQYKTEAGLELQMSTNHFGHFLLVNLLVPLLAGSGAGRVIVVSSVVHHWATIDVDDLNSEKTCHPNRIYARTKLANILFTKELDRRCKLTGLSVTANCLHPGTVQTKLFRVPLFGPVLEPLVSFFTWLFYTTPREGAQTSIYLAVSESVAGISGEYFSNCKLKRCSKEASDPVKAVNLWNRTCELVDLQPEESHL